MKQKGIKVEKTAQPEAVSSVLKVFNILEALAEQKEVGVSELSQRIMTSKATTYRFLQTMKGLGYVSQGGDDDKYAITLKMFELGANALNYVDLTKLADDEMRHISQQSSEAVHLGVLDGSSIVYVHKYASSYNLCMQTRIGSRNPLYCTAIGKVLAAGLNDAEVTEICKKLKFEKRTPQTIQSIEELLGELSLVREQHYGEDNEEQEPGLRCVAAPIYDRFGKVIAGISISFPLFRIEDGQFQQYVTMLQVAGKKISAKLGYHDYPFDD